MTMALPAEGEVVVRGVEAGDGFGAGDDPFQAFGQFLGIGPQLLAQV